MLPVPQAPHCTPQAGCLVRTCQPDDENMCDRQRVTPRATSALLAATVHAWLPLLLLLGCCSPGVGLLLFLLLHRRCGLDYTVPHALQARGSARIGQEPHNPVNVVTLNLDLRTPTTRPYAATVSGSTVRRACIVPPAGAPAATARERATASMSTTQGSVYHALGRLAAARQCPVRASVRCRGS